MPLFGSEFWMLLLWAVEDIIPQGLVTMDWQVPLRDENPMVETCATSSLHLRKLVFGQLKV